MATEVRRRKAETVTSSTTESEAPAEHESIIASDITSVKADSPFTTALLEKGRELIKKAEDSGFMEEGSLVKGLNYVVAAAGKGSKDASESLKKFVSARHEEVLQQLPDELQEVVHVFTAGSDTEQNAYQIASNMFDIMVGSDSGDKIKKDDMNTAAERLMLKEVEVVGPDAAKSALDFRLSVRKLLFVALVDSEDGPIVSCAIHVNIVPMY